MIPHFENSPSFISLVIATVGTTIAPWMIFLTQNNVVDKGVTPDELPLERVDAIGGAIVACAVAGFIIITTGTVLYPQGITVDSAAAAATALTPIAGQYATILFGVGLVAASFLAACVVPLVASSAICEAFGWERGVDRGWNDAPAFRGIYTAMIVIGVVVTLIPDVSLISIMLVAQFVSGVLLPVLLIFMVLILSDRHVMRAYTNRRLLTVLIWVLIVVVFVLTIGCLVMTVLGF